MMTHTLTPRYDPGAHFTRVIKATIFAHFPQLSLLAIHDARPGRRVEWEAPNGFHSHVVPECSKEDIFELVDVISRSLERRPT